MGETCGDHACCSGMKTTCGDESTCSGMGTRCGAHSLCSGIGAQCGASSICSGIDSVCGPGSRCTGLGAQCQGSMLPMPPIPSIEPMPTMPPMQTMPTMPPMESTSNVNNNGCDIGSSCIGRPVVGETNGIQYCCPRDCPDCAASASQTDTVLTVTCVCRKTQALGLLDAVDPLTSVRADDRFLWTTTPLFVAVLVVGTSLTIVSAACMFSRTFRRATLRRFQGWDPQEGQQSLLA